MYIRVARDIARPQMFAIMDLLKRSTGMSVKDLAKQLKMSYMGIKQHCVEMEKKGLVDTWRNAKEIGRPEKLYRLTEKASSFYPEIGNELTSEILHSVQELYGPNAPDKLLFSFFSKKTENYLKKIKGLTASEKAASFARLRDMEGHCAEFEVDHDLGTMQIVEYHSPFKEIAQTYPSVRRMEELMFSRVLGTSIQRSEESASGLTKHIFKLPAAGHQLSA
jgi:predicted ArsR family transcriptional regulator